MKARLARELRRVFNASDVAVHCGLRHGQITIDGHVIGERHLDRWTEAQLRGRTARFVGREARLFDCSARVGS